MSTNLLPHPSSQPTQSRAFRRWRGFLHSSGVLWTGIFFSAFVFVSLIFYTTIISPRSSILPRPSEWHDLPKDHLKSLELVDSSQNFTFPLPSPSMSTSTILDQASPSQPTPTSSSRPESDVLTIEQIRDIVARTRGFFTRDYSLGLGWNNVSGRHVSCVRVPS
jgi:hypothetical protein